MVGDELHREPHVDGAEGLRIGRYVLGPEIAAGGMASVHLGRMLGPGGFGKTVAMKRLHAPYARDPEFVKMFHDEARVTSGLTHPNIVMTLDVLEEDDSLYLVMEYVHGASMTQIHRRLADQAPVPQRIIVGIFAAMLDGLQAAHEARDENGEPLGIVHRDVSPQNVLVSFQGVAKIADFGIAKAAGRAHSTADGSAKGKVAYMAPEQVLATPLTARTDIYAAGVVLWESLTRRRLIDFNSTAESVRAVLQLVIEPPSSISADVSPELDKVVMRAVERSPANRFLSVKEMATALRRATDAAHAAEIGDWLHAERPNLIAARDKSLADLQRAIGLSSGTAVGLGPIPSTSSPGSAPRISTTTELDEPAASETGSGTREGSGSGEGHQLATPVAHDGGHSSAGRTPRWLFGVVVGLLTLGLAGTTLVVLSTRPTASTTRAVEPSTPIPSDEPSRRSQSGSPAAPSSEEVPLRSGSPAPSTSMDTTIEIDDMAPPSASATSSPASTTRRRPTSVPTSAPKRKCPLVPFADSAGHTKFVEVCP